MNTFKKKSLHAAVLAGLGALTVAGSANAVHVNPDGLGQVLIFPYYTTRAGNVTTISVINTTSNTKAVKVRFLEGKTSREVLDFNLWLSPADVWTGAVVPTTDGARLISNDNSCVTPSDLFQELPGRADLNHFKNFQYVAPAVGTDISRHGTTLDRTREGYFEVIEMGVVTNPVVTGFIKHGANGVPANCPAVDSFDPAVLVVPAQGFFGTGANLIANPTGGLAGRSSIINASNGSNYTLLPTAIDAWATVGVLPPGVPAPNVSQYTAAGVTSPDLSAVTPRTSNVFTSGGVSSSTWPTGAETMSAIIMRDQIVNEFILDAGTRSTTDWIVTQPTKRLHVFPGGATTRPFVQNYNFASAGCEPYNVGIYDREERTIRAAGAFIQPSPRLDTIETPAALCWEATVIPFDQASRILGSTNTSTLDPAVLNFAINAFTTTGPKVTPSLAGTQGANGWMLMSFSGVNKTITPTTSTFNGVAAPGAITGMPVIGAMLNNYVNTATAGSQYGSVSEHRYSRLIN